MSINLFELFAGQLREEHTPLSSVWMQNLAQEMSYAAHQKAGRSYGENHGLNMNQRAAQITGVVPEILDQPVNTFRFRRFAAEALGQTGADVGGWQKRIMAGDIPKELLDPDVQRRISDAVPTQTRVVDVKDGWPGQKASVTSKVVNPADIFSAARLAQEGTTVKDVAKEYAQGLVYSSAEFGMREGKFDQIKFNQAANSAMVGGLEAAYTFDPTRTNYFFNYMTRHQDAAVATDKRSIKSAFEPYGGVPKDIRMGVAETMFETFENLTVGMGANDTLTLSRNVEGKQVSSQMTLQEGYKLVTDHIEWMDQNQHEYRRGGWVDEGIYPGTATLKGTAAVFDYLERYAGQNGGVPVPGQQFNQFRYKDNGARMLSREEIVQLKQRYQSGEMGDEAAKRLMSNLNYSYQALSAKGYGDASPMTSIEQFEYQYQKSQESKGVFAVADPASPSPPGIPFSQSNQGHPEIRRFLKPDTRRPRTYGGEAVVKHYQPPIAEATRRAGRYEKDYIEGNDAVRPDPNFRIPSEKQVGYLARQITWDPPAVKGDRWQERPVDPLVKASVQGMTRSAKRKPGWPDGGPPQFISEGKVLANAGFYVPGINEQTYMALGTTPQERLQDNLNLYPKGIALGPMHGPENLEIRNTWTPDDSASQEERSFSGRERAAGFDEANPLIDDSNDGIESGENLMYAGSNSALAHATTPTGIGLSGTWNEDFLGTRSGVQSTKEQEQRFDWSLARERKAQYQREKHPAQTFDFSPDAVAVDALRSLVSTEVIKPARVSPRANARPVSAHWNDGSDPMAPNHPRRRGVSLEGNAPPMLSGARARHTGPVLTSEPPEGPSDWWDQLISSQGQSTSSSAQPPVRPVRPAHLAPPSMIDAAHEQSQMSAFNPARQYAGVPFIKQDELVGHEGNVMIFGQAGTGKTEVLAGMAAADARNGLDPKNMLFIASTRNAVGNWKERIGEKYPEELGDFRHISTIHSLGISALRRVAGRHDVPEDFGRPQTHHVIGSEETFGKVGDLLASTNKEAYMALDASGNLKPGYEKMLKDYTHAIGYMTSREYTPEDIRTNPELQRELQDNYKVNVGTLEETYREYNKWKTDNQYYDMQDLVTAPIKIAREHPEEKHTMFGGNYSGIYMDEVSAHSFSTSRMVGMVLDENPQARLRGTADPMQAYLWDWIGGSPGGALGMARERGMQIGSLREGFRVRQGVNDTAGDMFGIPEERRAFTVGDPMAESKRDRVASAYDLTVGKGYQDTQNALVRDVMNLVNGDPQMDRRQVGIIAKTNREVKSITENLRSKGVGVWNPPRWEDYIGELATGEMTQEDVRANIAAGMATRPPNSVAVMNQHQSPGLGFEHLYATTDDKDFPTQNAEDRFKSATSFYSTTTRSQANANDDTTGVVHLYGNVDRGGLPAFLGPYGMNVKTTSAATQQVGGAGGVDNLDLRTAQSRSAVESAFTRLPQPRNESTPAEQRAQDIVGGATRLAMGQAVQNEDARPVAKKFMGLLSDLIEQGMENVAQSLRAAQGDTQETRQQISAIRTAANKMATRGGAFYGESLNLSGGATGVPIAGGAGSTGGQPPSGGQPPLPPIEGGTVGPGHPQYNQILGGTGSSTGSRQSSSPYRSTGYRMGRAAIMGVRAVEAIAQGFGGEFNKAKQYGQYMNTYAPFAAMDGDLMGSAQSFGLQQMQVARGMQRGAYQNWGGFMRSYAEDMGEGGYRLASAGSAGWKMISAGAQASMSMAMVTGANPVSLVPLAVATAGAGALVGTTALMENYNNNRKPQGDTDTTWSRMFVDEVDYDRKVNDYWSEAKQAVAKEHGMSTEELDAAISGKDETSLFQRMFLGVGLGAEGVANQTKREFESAKTEGLRGEIYKKAEGLIQDRDEGLWRRMKVDPTLADKAMYLAEDIEENFGEGFSSGTNMIMSMMQTMPGGQEWALANARDFAERASKHGLSGNEAFTRIAQNAVNLGYAPGGPGFGAYVEQQKLDMSPAAMQAQDYYAGQVGQYGSQLQQYLHTPYLGSAAAKGLGIMTQTQANVAGAAIQSVQGYGYQDEGSLEAANLALNASSPTQAGMIAGIANKFDQLGFDPMTAWRGLATAGFSNVELGVAGQIMGGGRAGISALSDASWNGMFDGAFNGWENRFFNQLGEPIGTRSGMNFLSFAQANGIIPSTPIQGVTNNIPGIQNSATMYAQNGMMQGTMTGMTGAQAFQEFFGHSNMDSSYYEAWAEGGSQGAANNIQGQLADLAMASAGIQLRQLNANRAFNWGEGGSWDNPTSGSMWGLQDQMSALQHTSQMATFESRGAAMGAQWRYQTSINDLSGRRMNASQDYQNWNIDFNRNMQMKQRDWTRQDWAYQDKVSSMSWQGTQQDWAYQDTMSSLNWEWGLEDINESIRGATGRQRRNLITQRDRMTTTHNLESEQVDSTRDRMVEMHELEMEQLDTTRDRQEEMWEAQDERFEKQSAYQEELMTIEQENFELTKDHQKTMHGLEVADFERAKEEYEQERALQQEMQDLNREHQAEMMDLQEQSIGIQAASAALQKQAAEDNKAFQDEWLLFFTEAEKSNTNDPASGTIGQMHDLIDTLAKNTPAVKELKSAVDALAQGNIAANGAAIQEVIGAMMGVDLWTLQQLAYWVREIGSP